MLFDILVRRYFTFVNKMSHHKEDQEYLEALSIIDDNLSNIL